MSALRPGQFCRELLVALEATEGRRKRRKRDTTPDGIGLSIKQKLLEAAMREDPGAEDFEAWLLEQCLRAGPGSGAVRAMAVSIRDEWRLVNLTDGYRDWLANGAPSDDRQPTSERGG
jgi:hypothetical protein